MKIKDFGVERWMDLYENILACRSPARLDCRSKGVDSRRGDSS
ncbi:hypothetical protein [Paraburkholderia sp.]|nr:hypothetical protein [Paraburkholderia sp.]